MNPQVWKSEMVRMGEYRFPHAVVVFGEDLFFVGMPTMFCSSLLTHENGNVLRAI